MMAELLSKWLCFPLSKQLRGFQFPLLAYSPGAQVFTWSSFGLAAALLIALGTFAFVFGKNRLLCWIGAGLVWLSGAAILKVAFLDAPLLAELASELDQQQGATTFAQAALPVNAGAAPSVWPHVPLDTIGDRLMAGWYFARFGCWLSLLAGIVALAIGAEERRRFTMTGLTLCGMAILLGTAAAGPVLAGTLAERARIAEAHGDADRAIACYRRALELDGWTARQLGIYERIGAIDASFARTETVEFGIYHAELPSTQIDLTKSIAELTALIPRAREPLAGVLRRRAAALGTQHARILHAAAAYGAAIGECQAALRLDPLALLPACYLSREYYLIGAYPEAIALTEKVVARIDDPILHANLYSNIGDAQTRLGAFEEARLAYRRSYAHDYLLNLRALSALNGP